MQGAIIGRGKNKIGHDQHIDEEKMGPCLPAEQKAVHQNQHVIDKKEKMPAEQRMVQTPIDRYHAEDQQSTHEVEKGHTWVIQPPVEKHIDFDERCDNQRDLIAYPQTAKFPGRTLRIFPSFRHFFPDQRKLIQGKSREKGSFATALGWTFVLFVQSRCQSTEPRYDISFGKPEQETM